MVEEGKSVLDRILSVTLLEDLQINAPLIYDDVPIITYPDASDISALLAREELLQLHFPCQSKKIASTMTLGTCQRLPPAS
jgi:hypothetical protein